MIGWTLGMSFAIFLMLSKGVDSPQDHAKQKKLPLPRVESARHQDGLLL
jgi:hypothetical protein